jgi:hypothetical protein
VQQRAFSDASDIEEGKMPAGKKATMEIHFAVSDKVSVYTGKDAVSHIGFSVGDTGYNCGRNEGRNEESILSFGPYVAVRSPYRMDGFYLKLTESERIAKAFQEFVDRYLENRLDENGRETAVENTRTRIPASFLEKMWFVKTVRGLKDIAAIKSLWNIDYMTYEKQIRPQYGLLNRIDFEEFEEFRYAEDLREECDVLRHAYPFFRGMTVARYRRLRQLSAPQRDAFIDLLIALKGDLSNRMYDTGVLTAPVFNSGQYKMVQGYNCVNAAFFLLERGLIYAVNQLRSFPDLVKETKQIQAMVAKMQNGNRRLKIPWRSFRRARWHADEFSGIGFVDTPEDGIYWKDIRKIRTESYLTDPKKQRALRVRARRKLISKLTKQTDVIEYEQEGVEYVSFNKIPGDMKQQCNRYKDLLPMVRLGKGGGKRTRFT